MMLVISVLISYITLCGVTLCYIMFVLFTMQCTELFMGKTSCRPSFRKAITARKGKHRCKEMCSKSVWQPFIRWSTRTRSVKEWQLTRTGIAGKP